jgi:hypothetical protein
MYFELFKSTTFYIEEWSTNILYYSGILDFSSSQIYHQKLLCMVINEHEYFFWKIQYAPVILKNDQWIFYIEEWSMNMLHWRMINEYFILKNDQWIFYVEEW